MKTRKLNRIFALLLTLIMALGTAPLSAIAAAAEAESTPYVLLYSKTCENSETIKLYPDTVSEKYGNKAVLTKDGTLWLNGYDSGPIHAFGFENFSIALKGNNTVYHDSTKHKADSAYKDSGSFLYSAIMAFDSHGFIDYPENLTIRSYSATEKGNIAITSVAPTGVEFGKNDQRDIRAVTAKKLVLNNVNLSFTIDCKKNKIFAASGILTYGGLYVSNSTIDGKITNCQPNNYAKYHNYSENIRGIWTKGSETSIVGSDVNIVFDNSGTSKGRALCGIHNSSYNSINIKGSNVNIRDDSKLSSSQNSYGIGNYYYQSARNNPNDNRLNITDNSVVTIAGNNWNYGIYDGFDFKTDVVDDNTTGVTVNGSRLEISGVKKGIYAASRGVNFVNAEVEVRSQKEAVCGADDENGNSSNQNKSPYGLHISGCSLVNLTSNESKVVSMVPYEDYKCGRSRIDLSPGGTVSFNTYNADSAENIMPMCDYVSLGVNNIVKKGTPTEEIITDKDGKTAYTRYYGEKTSEILTTFSVAYADNINVRWYTDTNTVRWNKGISPVDKYILTLEAAPNYGVTPVYSEFSSSVIVTGNSYTLPEEITKYLIDTMYYRIKLIPIISGETPSETVGYSNEKTAKKQVEDITVTVKDSTTVRWNTVEGANGYYYIISKYNEATGTYEVCYTAETSDNILKIYSKYKDKPWYGEGKYNVSVRALFKASTSETGTNSGIVNVLGRGALKTPLTVKHYSVNHGTSYINSQFNLTVVRDGLAVKNADTNRLLAGDRVTLKYKSTTDDGINGWYVNSRLSGITKELSEDKKSVEFIMPPADVTAYPLIGVEEIKSLELYYDRNYNFGGLSYLSEVETRLDYEDAFDRDKKLGTVQITWRNEQGNIITEPSSAPIDNTKNYIGEVTLYPAKGYLFTDNSSVNMYDYLSMEDGWTDSEITNGRVENGCYIFTLYLINKAKVTVPRAAAGVYDIKSAITGDGITGNDLYSFSAKSNIGELNSGNILITDAYVLRKNGQLLFGDNPSVEVNGTTYPGYLILDEEFISKIRISRSIYLYSNNRIPVLNYKSGTTFHAEYGGTEINLVKLVDTYIKSIENPNAVVYYQVDGGEVKQVGLNDPIVFTAKGSSYVSSPKKTELTVWVDNGPKTTYYYYAVDAIYGAFPYIPKLSVSSTTFTDYIWLEVANPLPNLEYYYDIVDYDTEKDWDDNPDHWYNIKEYTGRFRIKKSCRVRLGAKTLSDGEMTETKKTTAETYMRDYGKPVLNLKNGTAIHCKTAGTLNNCVKLDSTYLKNLDDDAKIAYQVNGGETKYLTKKTDYFEIEITKVPDLDTKTKITVWVDDGDKATYTYKTCPQNNFEAVVAHPTTYTEFDDILNIRLESTVPNYKSIRYKIDGSNSYYTYNGSIRLERKNGGITLVNNNINTGKSEITLVFDVVFADGTYSRNSKAVYRLSDSVTGMATSVTVHNNQTLNSTYRYYDSANKCLTTTKNAYCTASFDPETGTLTLDGYGDGSIIANGSLNINLAGNATVNGYIKCTGDLYIYGNGTLHVTALSAVSGQNYYCAVYATGKVHLSTESTVNLKVDNPYSAAGAAHYGIYGRSVLIDHKTSLDININNSNGANYGIAASTGMIEIDTTGNIEIVLEGYSDTSSYEQAPFYLGSSNNNMSVYIHDVGYIKLTHPNISETGSKNSAVIISEPDTIYRVQDYFDNNYVTEFIKGVKLEEKHTAIIEGTVASSGSPTKPVTVELYDSDGKLCGTLTLYGNNTPYVFKNLAAGTYTLKVSKAGHLSEERKEVLDQYGEGGGLITLEMPSISGTITSLGGEDDPVTAELWKKDGTSPEETFVGKGYTVDYTFNNNGNGLDAESEYYIVVKKENHKDYVLDYYIHFNSVVERKNEDIWLTVEYAKVSGSISLEETADNTAAANTSIIFIEDTDFDPHIVRATVVYDTYGRPTGYSANLLVDTRYVMTVAADGYMTYISYVSPYKYPITHDVLLKADTGIDPSLSGTVISQGSEDEDIIITLTPKGESEPEYETVVNGNNTTFLFTEVPAGIYKLTVIKAGNGRWSNDIIVSADKNQVNVVLSKIKGLQISGKVTSYGEPDDDITVWLLRDGKEYPAYELTLSGDSTKYAFYGVEADNYTLIAVKNGHITYQELLTADSVDIVKDITLYLKGDVNVDGTVNILDLIRIKKILAGDYTASATECQTAEINGDGYIDANDLIALRQMLLGVSVSVGNSNGVKVSGTVTSYGNETADITVQLIPDGATSPAYQVKVKGNTATYSINDVAKGVYILRVIKNGSTTRDYTLTVESLNITQNVTVYPSGDVTGDGAVDIRDLIRLKKINAKTAAAENGTSADVNADGNENAADLVDLRKKLLGLAV